MLLRYDAICASLINGGREREWEWKAYGDTIAPFGLLYSAYTQHSDTHTQWTKYQITASYKINEANSFHKCIIHTQIHTRWYAPNVHGVCTFDVNQIIHHCDRHCLGIYVSVCACVLSFMPISTKNTAVEKKRKNGNITQSMDGKSLCSAYVACSQMKSLACYLQ